MDKKLLYSAALLFSLLFQQVGQQAWATSADNAIKAEKEKVEQVRSIFKSLEERRLTLLEEGTIPINNDENELYFSEIEFFTKEGTAAAKDSKSKVQLRYDENKNKLEVSILRWDNQELKWNNTFRERSVYSSNGMLNELVYEQWNNENNLWKGIGRELFAYDKNDNLTQNDFQQIVPNGQSINLARYVFHYSNEGYLSEQIEQQWNKDDKNWANAKRTLYAYDNDGYEIEENIQSAIGKKDWANSRRMQYEYSVDADTKQTQVVTVFQKWQDSRWVTESREMCTNDDIAMQTDKVEQNWNSSTARWENSFRTLKKYHKSGNLNELESFFWNEEIQNWENATRMLNIYDDANRLVEIVDQQWGGNGCENGLGGQGWISNSNARVGYTEQESKGRMDP